MICSLSGQPTLDPVISPKSGAIFDRSLILKYLQGSETDPITDDILSQDELILVRIPAGEAISVVKPPSSWSIPSLLSAFQDEWDALSIEVFSLRKQLHKARQELSASLYQYEAAIRVSSKLLQERDEARSALQDLSIAIGEGDVDKIHQHVSTNHDHGEAKLSDETKTRITESQAALFAEHKANKRVSPLSDHQVSFNHEKEKVHVLPFKKVSASFHDVKLHQILAGSPSGVLAVVETDGNVQKLVEASKTLKNITAITTVTGHNTPVIAHTKGNVTLVNDGKEIVLQHPDIGEIVLVVTHPGLPDIFALFASEGTWTLHELHDGRECRLLLQAGDKLVQFTSGDFHVDGALLAAGTNDGHIQVYETISGKLASSISVGHSKVIKIKFSLNGYWVFVLSGEENLALALARRTLDVLDLRKSKIVHTIEGEIEDFDVDSSSTVVVTALAKGLKLHRYYKKGKKWENNQAETALELPLGRLFIQDQERGIRVLGLTPDAQVKIYTLT